MDSVIMRLNKKISIFLLFIVMLCCISVVSAASDSAMDDLNANLDQGADVSSVAIDENEYSLSVPQEENSLSK